MTSSNLEANAAAFLATRGLTLSDLSAFAPAVREGETLLLCSTVVEGLANGVSDIDLLYLGDGELRGATSLQHDEAGVLDVAFDPRGNEVNVQRIATADLRAMAGRMASTIGAIDEPLGAKGRVIELDMRRLQTLHRIRNSIVLANPGVCADWREKLLTNRLHEHLCLQGLLGYCGFREDVLGELIAGADESALWIARTMMAQNLIAALLHSVGETNTNRKWHLKLLRRLAPQIGEASVDQLIGFVLSPQAKAADLPVYIETALDPIADEIQGRLRTVRRAALAFGQSVRYSKTYRALRSELTARSAAPAASGATP